MAVTELEMELAQHGTETEPEREQRARLTAAQRAALPDSAFAYIDANGGRHYPIHDAAHVRNALARIAQGTKFGAEALPKVKAAAKKFGIDTGGSHGISRSPEWTQRRKRWAGSLIGQEARRSMKLAPGSIEVRAKPDGTGGTRFEFRGYGATFGDSFEMWDKWGDPYDESVEPGAFSNSLKRADLDTPFLIGHNEAGIPLARTWETLKLGADTRGLESVASMNGRRSDVRDLAIAVEDKNITEMSIGFVTRGQRWSDDYEHRYMTDLDLHRGDVSVVALAANPATKGVSMVALPTEILSRQAAEERAQLTQADADDQDHDHMIPMVGPNHPAFTGRHSHAHPAFDGPDSDGDGMHGHDHEHQGDNLHQHSHADVPEQAPTSGGVADDYDLVSLGSAQPLEHRGNPVSLGMGDPPAYNVWTHAAPGTRRCMNPACTIDGGAMNHPDAKYCDQCGGTLSGDDALVRLNDDGVPGMTEEHGEVATLALRRRRLELLKLAAR